MPDDQNDFSTQYNFDLRPQSWLAKADVLTSIAESLFPALDEVWAEGAAAHAAQREGRQVGLVRLPLSLGPAVLMLLGFAAENLLKGRLLIGSTPTGTLPEHLHRHDLFSFARRAGIALDEMEEQTLKTLTVAAEWSGRYPAPLAHDRYERRFASGWTSDARMLGSHMHHDGIALVRRLRAELVELLERRQPEAPP